MNWLYAIPMFFILSMGNIGAYAYFTRKHPKPGSLTIAERERDKRHAEKVAAGWGSLFLSFMQIAFGLLGLIPTFAAAGWAGAGFTPKPGLGTVIGHALIFVVGWTMFAKLVRLNDALEDRPELSQGS